MYPFLRKTLLSLFWISQFAIPNLFGQETKAELVYACENCVLTSYLPMGEDYKVLIYASNDKPMKRRMYLLDKSNLIVDEMKVDAAQTFVKVNDSIFSPIDIGDAIMIQIKDQRLNVREAYEFYRPAKHGINTANVF